MQALANFRWERSVILLLLAVLTIIFFFNVFGTLRLNTDAITLLESALSDLEGHHKETVFPPGFPFLLKGLLLSGSASPVTLGFLNVAFLGIGVYASYWLCLSCFYNISRRVALTLSLFTLLSWIVIKHVPIPLTDIPFFGLAMTSLLLIETARRTLSGRYALLVFIAAFILVFASIGVRRIGIALVPSLLVGAFLWRGGAWWTSSFSRRSRFINGGLLIAAIILLILWWKSTATLVDYPGAGFSVASALTSVVSAFGFRLPELVQVVFNFPASTFPGGSAVYLELSGAILAATLLFGVYKNIRSRHRLGICDVYFIMYGAILFVWPYSDPRFLLPVIPFVLAYIYIALKSLLSPRFERSVFAMWGLVFISLGAISLTYSARIATAGSAFPQAYGDGTLRDTYCAYLKTCDSFDPQKVNADAFKILNAFKG